ncbi:hypothetical protein BAE44_0013693 [Dichanthelium oligosanthes]|uniref:DUF676 domain-containing protein n=1 Tax=Dichanthelium oligosanthes TaxID=888268 RepID=A0A1E5VJI9_9POAL|nr:hypothetical protein BAE44_0013693 [Dichanthelium oligosanthes]
MGDLGRGGWREAAAEKDTAPAPARGGPDHLLVMVHGIVGSTADWKFGAQQFDKLLSDKVIVHCSNCNMYKLTLDGIDVMGERLAQEVIEEINRRPDIKKISFVAHSVGGLVARYAIGRLYRSPKLTSENAPQSLSDDNRGTIHGLEAVNFITVASPHLGSRGNKQVPFLFGVTAIENFACYIIHFIFGRTGKHLFLTDNDEGKPPLLQCMVDNWGDLQFMSALQAFRRRVAYSNVRHDQRLLRGLKRVSWEKVDVSFHNSKVRSAAHSLIQVKDPVMHCEGADVIQHMIDHFTL